MRPWTPAAYALGIVLVLAWPLALFRGMVPGMQWFPWLLGAALVGAIGLTAWGTAARRSLPAVAAAWLLVWVAWPMMLSGIGVFGLLAAAAALALARWRGPWRELARTGARALGAGAAAQLAFIVAWQMFQGVSSAAAASFQLLFFGSLAALVLVPWWPGARGTTP